MYFNNLLEQLTGLFVVHATGSDCDFTNNCRRKMTPYAVGIQSH